MYEMAKPAGDEDNNKDVQVVLATETQRELLNSSMIESVKSTVFQLVSPTKDSVLPETADLMR